VLVEGGRYRNGGRSDEPKIASTMWSVSLSAAGKSSVKGIERFLSCVDRRCQVVSRSLFLFGTYECD
jgi:hypothetical protein